MSQKLDLYLNSSQYEKLQILASHTGYSTAEEAANEFFYTALTAAWTNYKSNQIKDALESDSLDDETIHVTVDGITSDVWSDGEMAVLDYEDNTATVQLIDSKYYYVLENGTRVECSEETCKEIQKILEAAGKELKNFSMENLDQ